MTEDEAKTKWCPHVQITDMDGLEGDNRGDGGGSYKCLGSDCMVWRFSNEKLGHDLKYQISNHGDELGRKRHAQFLRIDPIHGYCGLAGKP